MFLGCSNHWTWQLFAPCLSTMKWPGHGGLFSCKQLTTLTLPSKGHGYLGTHNMWIKTVFKPYSLWNIFRPWDDVDVMLTDFWRCLYWNLYRSFHFTLTIWFRPGNDIYTENKRWSFSQLGHHWWHCKLSNDISWCQWWWQKLPSWQSFVFSMLTHYTLVMPYDIIDSPWLIDQCEVWGVLCELDPFAIFVLYHYVITHYIRPCCSKTII